MLVLTRKLGESIIIDNNIEIVVLKLMSGQIKLGINAPSQVSVHRGEVARRIGENVIAVKEKFEV